MERIFTDDRVTKTVLAIQRGAVPILWRDPPEDGAVPLEKRQIVGIVQGVDYGRRTAVVYWETGKVQTEQLEDLTPVTEPFGAE